MADSAGMPARECSICPMRMLLLIALTLAAPLLLPAAEDIRQILEGLRTKPDLHPQLTPEEVDAALASWLGKMSELVDANLKTADSLPATVQAHHALAGRLEEITAITIYS